MDRSWLVWIAGPFFGVVLFLLCAWDLFAFINTNRSEARAARCLGGLSQIHLAMMNYKAEHGQFPPLIVRGKNDEPMHSWRVLLLPYLDAGDLYRKYRFSEPWNSQHNRRCLDSAPFGVAERFGCGDFDRGERFASFLAIHGSDDTKLLCVEDLSYWPMISEVRHSKVLWYEPSDIGREEFGRQVLVEGEEVNVITRHGMPGTISDGGFCCRGGRAEVLKYLGR